MSPDRTISIIDNYSKCNKKILRFDLSMTGVHKNRIKKLYYFFIYLVGRKFRGPSNSQPFKDDNHYTEIYWDTK